jgi:acyl-CoA reductase-like NAD-dependent aldehyde dehydrogenase
MTIDIPALCFGTEYHSLSRHPIVDLGSGEELGSLGLVLENRIATDCLREGLPRRALDALRQIPVRRRIQMSVLAADIFEGDTLECGGSAQSPDDYTDWLARTSGLSFALARANTARIAAALRDTEAVMNGLTRGLPLDVLDAGVGEQGGATVRLNPRIDALGCCMPNNSPGVNVIWLVVPAFGIPVLIRPGSGEPFTAYRLIRAHIRAGYPAEAFGYYPCDHAAANRIPLLTRGAIVFGSDDTVKKWAGHPLVQIHGAGYSKVFIGGDRVGSWESLIPDLALNVAANSGRSCFAASRICVPRHGREIAAALAAELAKLIPLPLEHPDAKLSAMAMPKAAEAASGMIDRGLKEGGATDVSATVRDAPRPMTFEGRTYLLPTVVRCDANGHTLANQEFLFPYVAVVECPTDAAFAEMGPTLSLAVYTDDGALKVRARRSGARLVSVNKPTVALDRRQPHEEDLFTLLYERLSYVE